MTPYGLANVLSGAGASLRGDLPPETVFAKIERDARQVQPGDLYIALHGDRFDGHVMIVGQQGSRGSRFELLDRRLRIGLILPWLLLPVLVRRARRRLTFARIGNLPFPVDHPSVGGGQSHLPVNSDAAPFLRHGGIGLRRLSDFDGKLGLPVQHHAKQPGPPAASARQ